MTNTNYPIPFTNLSDLPPPSDHTMFSLATSKEAQGPITKNPIHFSVLYRNWYTSNAWGVKVRKKTGDAYIYCRDHMAGQKVSLHASGKQHISIDPNPQGAASITHKEFMNQWHEPEEGIATFKLIFPPWGIQLSGEQIKDHDSVWKKNDIYIEGHHEFLTVISFYIVNEKAVFEKKSTFPGFLLGELPLKSGKKLGITAEWEPDRGFKTKIENTFPGLAESLSEEHLDQTLTLSITGWNGPNSAFMTSFPVTYRPKS